MNTRSCPFVTFFTVKDNKSKIDLICNKALEAFEQEKPLLILAPNLQAAQFIDDLLWRFPESGFLPHVITDMPSTEWVVITLQANQNINKAQRLLNLTSGLSPLHDMFGEIYEILDETHPQKLALSQERLALCKSKGYQVKTFS